MARLFSDSLIFNKHLNIGLTNDNDNKKCTGLRKGEENEHASVVQGLRRCNTISISIDVKVNDTY